MKLGMIIRPQPEEFAHLKALGLDFAELDLNPVDFLASRSARPKRTSPPSRPLPRKTASRSKRSAAGPATS